MSHQTEEVSEVVPPTTASSSTEEPSSTQSNTTPRKKQLTDEEKREILRRRRLEKIKNQGESRMTKLMYGDAVASDSPAKSNPVASTTNNEGDNQPGSCTPIRNSHSSTLGSTPASYTPLTPETPEISGSAYRSQMLERNIEMDSPVFKLHNLKNIEKEEKEYHQPFEVKTETITTIPNVDKQQESSPRKTEKPEDLKLTSIDTESELKIDTPRFDKFRPLIVLILAILCAISSIQDNNGVATVTQSNADQDLFSTFFEFFNSMTPIAILLSFEIAMTVPNLFMGKTIFSMQTETALDMFLFAKAVYNGINKVVSDASLFLFTYIVIHSIHAIIINYHHSENMFSQIMEPFVDVTTVVWNQVTQFMTKDH